MSKQNSILFFGFLITLFISLSIHILMLQVIGVGFPDHSPVPTISKLLNTWFSVLALFTFYYLGKERLSKKSIAIQTLIVFAIYSMIKESLIRANVMEAVVTTAWLFPFIKSAPGLLNYFILAFIIVLTNRFLYKKWQLIIASILAAAFIKSVLEPLMGSVFSPVIASYSYLAHEAIYQMPYGWEVMIPAYLTFAEPVFAAFLILYFIWEKIAVKNIHKIVLTGILISLMKGTLLPLFIYTPYMKLNLTSAMASEGQFTLEFLALGMLATFFWGWYRKPQYLAERR